MFKLGTSSVAVDAESLESELREIIEGEVRFDNGSRAMYSVDASNYQQIPIGVVIPGSTEDIIQTIRLARRWGAPVLSRGGGTSLAGQCCNVAVVMDHSKYYNRILELNAKEQYAIVEPGCVLDDLRDKAEQHHLTFGPDPATHNRCTLGGMLGNDSCGPHSVMAGRTADNVQELEIVTYDGLRMKVGPTPEDELQKIIEMGGRRGEIYRRMRDLRDRFGDEIRKRYPDIPRRVSGYNLDELLPEKGFNVARALVGSEGTLVTILNAKLRLIPSPPARALLVLGYDSVFSAGDHIPDVMETGPTACEGIDDRLTEYMRKKDFHVEYLKYLPEGKGWLLVEYGGETREEAQQKAREAMEKLENTDHPPAMELYDDKDKEEHVWQVRESGLGATAFVPGIPDAWPGWEDSAVPPDRVGDYLREFRKKLDEYGYQCSLYGHFGQGCIHTRIDFDLRGNEGLTKYRKFVDEMADIVVSFNGSLSGEHGDGQARAALLPKMFGEDLVGAFRDFKKIWDPEWKMNPGKVVDAYDITENLRLGTDYEPWEPETGFAYPEDHFNFARATLRCVGVGKCRRKSGGTMCPSYMVTHEEKHTTRGRAHLLFEMLNGKVITDGWRSEEVKESLDLCLACKGCKGDCPVDVDIATLKAEFLSHYYKGKIRPRSAYAFGLIMYWARIASKMPNVVNFLAETPPFSGIAKKLAGMPEEREIPKFAPRTFKEWFANRDLYNLGGPKVILWPDTFNNHFHPHIARAAVTVLESGGYNVIVPMQKLCCGRPLYDYGFLDLAKKLLRQIMRTLRNEIRAGIPIVGLEPSCVSVFRDELKGMFPNDEDAKRLNKQVYTLSEFLENNEERFRFPRLERKAVVHGHCHHKSILGMNPEEEIFRKIGLDADLVDSGCCGMAGSFGFEEDKYDVSIACGERVLLPKVRETPEEEILIADGFSCHEQVRQQTGRQTLHLAEVLQLALRQR